MLTTPNLGNLILRTPIPGNLLLATPTSGIPMLTTSTPGTDLMLTIPTPGNVNVTHPRESDVDTYSGETDVNVTYSREGIWCWRWPIPKIQRSRNFPIYSVQPGELCWIEWMNFLLLNILQRTSDISAKNPNWNQNENMPWGKGCILKSYLHSPQKKRSGERSWQNQRTLLTGH